jgi:UPF0716 family protein affecting phage T7 exclusion
MVGTIILFAVNKVAELATVIMLAKELGGTFTMRLTAVARLIEAGLMRRPKA